MISMEKEKSNVSMQRLCNRILDLDGVRFAGLISNYGNLYAGGFKKGIVPHDDDEERRLMYMRFALESCFRRDFDDSLGELKYSTIERKKVSILTINICNYLLLVFSEPTIDIHALAQRVEKIIDENQVKH